MADIKKDKHPIVSCFEMKTLLKERKQDKALFTVKTGMPALDDATEGMQDGEVYAISGARKSGKTLLGQSFTVKFAEQQYYSLWFSYEVMPRQFMAGFEDDMPLFYLPDGLEAGAFNWVERKMLESFEQYHTRIIFIDHLHYLFDIAQTRNPSLTIGSLIRRLHKLAEENQFLIFLLCHTTKGASEGADLSDESIRDSSLISQESDSVLMIQRTGNYEGKLKLEFHRRTGAFQIMIPIIKIGKYFEEKTDRVPF